MGFDEIFLMLIGGGYATSLEHQDFKSATMSGDSLRVSLEPRSLVLGLSRAVSECGFVSLARQ